MQTGRLTPPSALMPPGVHDQKQEDDKPERQKHDGPRLVLPELLEAAKRLVEVHLKAMYTRIGKSQRRTRR